MNYDVSIADIVVHLHPESLCDDKMKSYTSLNPIFPVCMN